MTFYVKQIRQQEGMSIKKLSNVSGVSRTHIRDIEEGKTNPTIDIMCKLAKSLNVELTELFDNPYN